MKDDLGRGGDGVIYRYMDRERETNSIEIEIEIEIDELIKCLCVAALPWHDPHQT